MQKYTISTIAEEGPCAYCGEPMLVGDTAYEHDGEIFCSRRCVKNSETDPRPTYYCPFCEDRTVPEPDMLCMKCTRMFMDAADRADHINRCDW
jgi:hypothetical protein